MTQHYFIILCPGADVIKLFCLYFKKFLTKLECLLDQAVKACQGQTLYLITKICKLRTKKFLTLGPGSNPIKLFIPVIYEQLEYLSLLGLSSLVKCLWIRPEPARAKRILGYPLFGRLLALPINIRLGWKGPLNERSSLLCTLINYGCKKSCVILPWRCQDIQPYDIQQIDTQNNSLKATSEFTFQQYFMLSHYALP